MIKLIQVLSVLLLVSLVSSCGVQKVRTQKSAWDNRNLSQLEKDIEACEVGKPLYMECTYTPSGYTFDYDWGKEKYNDYADYKSGSCYSGERKVGLSLNLFGAKTYVRRVDITECMNQKGYVYHHATKWVKDRLGFIYTKGVWLTPEESSSNQNNPLKVLRPYVERSCTGKSSSNRIRRCVENGQYYQGDGQLAGQMFYPDYIINKLSERGFSIKYIQTYEANLSSENKPALENNQNTAEKYSASRPSIIENVKKNRTPPKSSINKSKAIDAQDRIKKSHNSYIENLKEIKSLLDNGVINQDDFEKLKQKIINKLD
jgi:hypothetical protein